MKKISLIIAAVSMLFAASANAQQPTKNDMKAAAPHADVKAANPEAAPETKPAKKHKKHKKHEEKTTTTEETKK